MTGLPGRDWHLACHLTIGTRIRHEGVAATVTGATYVGQYLIIDTDAGQHFTVHHLSSVEVLTL